MIKKILASVVLLGCVTSGVQAQQSFGHWAVMQCQPAQERLALVEKHQNDMPFSEENKIVEEGETLEIIAQNYKYRLEELESQIDSLNQSIKSERDLIKESEAFLP
jgi:hypothetical protein